MEFFHINFVFIFIVQQQWAFCAKIMVIAKQGVINFIVKYSLEINYSVPNGSRSF